MATIREAKKHLGELYRSEDGFVGIHIDRHNNQDVLCVYVTDSSSPFAQLLKRNGEFEGFPVEVQVSGIVQALPAPNGRY